MPLGIIDDEDFELEIAKSQREHAKIVTVINNHGRGTGKSEIPAAIREVIAEEVINGAPARTISQELNISQSSISAYKNGATSTATYNKPDAVLKSANDRVKERISKLAKNRLRRAIEAIDDEKIEACDAVKLGKVAADMSRVIDKMEPKEGSSGVVNNIIFYTPERRTIDKYETIDVN